CARRLIAGWSLGRSPYFDYW
nr:immunoglobulin heavy chain junction region [Macaca mulatta]